MKEFITNLYDYEYAGIKSEGNEEEDSDDENIIEVKLNDVHAETALGDTLIQKEGNNSREEQIENEEEVIEIY